MSSSNNLVKFFELNAESTQILSDCAKYGITSTSVDGITLRALDEQQKGLKLEKSLIEVESEIAKVDVDLADEMKEIESLKNVLKEQKPVEPDARTKKMIEKLTNAKEQLSSDNDVNLIDIVKKVEKLEK